MINVTEFSEKQVKEFLAELFEKYDIDEDKWREHLNSLPKEQRSMSFSFDTEKVKKGFTVNFNYIFTNIDIIITDEELKKDIEEGNVE